MSKSKTKPGAPIKADAPTGSEPLDSENLRHDQALARPGSELPDGVDQRTDFYENKVKTEGAPGVPPVAEQGRPTTVGDRETTPNPAAGTTSQTNELATERGEIPDPAVKTPNKKLLRRLKDSGPPHHTKDRRANPNDGDDRSLDKLGELGKDDSVSAERRRRDERPNVAEAAANGRVLPQDTIMKLGSADITVPAGTVVTFTGWENDATFGGLLAQAGQAVTGLRFKHNSMTGALMPIDDQELTEEDLEDFTEDDWAMFGYSFDQIADKKRHLLDRLMRTESDEAKRLRRTNAD